MKKIFILIFFGILILNSLPAYAAGEEAPPRTAESLYSYDPDNPPRYFFFPKEKARWDGSSVTLKEWYLLTDLQKEKFVSEYMAEVNRKYNAVIDVIGFDYISALNVFSYYSDKGTLNEPSTKFIDILLEGQGKITKK
jgi:hypothetical protein